jgi:hypothetical protein
MPFWHEQSFYFLDINIPKSSINLLTSFAGIATSEEGE